MISLVVSASWSKDLELDFSPAKIEYLPVTSSSRKEEIREKTELEERGVYLVLNLI